MDFLKWLNKTSKDKVTFIDESLYLDLPTNTWWIDSGATVHVANSLQRFHMKRTLPKGERSIRVANGLKVGVDAIGDLALELDGGFILYLRNILFVPSMRRNLISVSCLDDENIHYHFGDGKCVIQYNNENVGLAIRQDELYLLSHCESVNDMSTSSAMNVCDESAKRKRSDNESSSKLWHHRLSHISRGRIERLIKEEILHPLDFSDSEYCIDCIKGKYVKQIKKDAKRSA